MRCRCGGGTLQVLHAFFDVFWCDTVGTYALLKAAQFVMYLHAIVQMHVLHNFADSCFLFHCLLKAQGMRWCRKYRHVTACPWNLKLWVQFLAKTTETNSLMVLFACFTSVQNSVVHGRKHVTKIGKTFARNEERWKERLDWYAWEESAGASGRVFLGQFSVSIQGWSWNLGFTIAWSCYWPASAPQDLRRQNQALFQKIIRPTIPGTHRATCCTHAPLRFGSKNYLVCELAAKQGSSFASNDWNSTFLQFPSCKPRLSKLSGHVGEAAKQILPAARLMLRPLRIQQALHPWTSQSQTCRAWKGALKPKSQHKPARPTKTHHPPIRPFHERKCWFRRHKTVPKPSRNEI